MAMDMFIQIGALKGESRDSVHKEKTDVLAWSWGMSNSGSAHVGGGAGAGKVNVQDLSFTKYIDKTSTELMLASCNGKHFPDALLIVRKAGEKPVEYLKIKMEDVLVSSYQAAGAEGSNNETPSEQISINFAKIEFDYTAPDGTLSSFNFDIRANR